MAVSTKSVLIIGAVVVGVALLLKKSNLKLGGINPFYQGPQPQNFGGV